MPTKEMVKTLNSEFKARRAKMRYIEQHDLFEEFEDWIVDNEARMAQIRNSLNNFKL